MKAMVEPMTRASGGAIVNIASTAGMMGIRGLSVYSASKWAVRGISRVAAMELAPLNIRVNTILPGHILTPLATRMSDGPELFEVGKAYPIGRLGTARESANATLFPGTDDPATCLTANWSSMAAWFSSGSAQMPETGITEFSQHSGVKLIADRRAI